MRKDDKIESMEPAHKGKLRNRIFLVTLVGLIPIAAAVALGVYAVNTSHREDVSRLEAAVLTQKAQEVINFVDGQILTQTRVLVPHGPGLEVSTSAQKFVLGQTLGSLSFLESESFINLAGQEMTHLDRTHTDGYPAAELRNMSDTPEFRAARAGNYYVSPVSSAPRGPMITFASPAKDDQGNIIAVVTGEASLNPVKDIIAKAKIGDTGYLYLFDANGTMIGGGATSSVLGSAIVQKVLAGNDLLTAATQMNYKNAAGQPVVAAGKYIPQYGWGLVAEWPTQEANAVINQLFTQNAFALGLVLLIMFAISLLLASHIVRPVKKLQEGAERVAQGKFNEGVSIKTGDELEELGESFDDMVQGLKRLEDLKDEFVFIAAHELRTPVSAMKGYLSLILDGATGAVPDKTKEYIQKVIAADNRLVQLVNDLLEVARSEAGRLTIKVSAMDLTEPIRMVLDELKSLADEKNVKLVYEPSATLPKVMGDPDRIKEVMVNLVGNAIKYMGGTGSVIISHEIKDGNVVTHVADTGFGISKDAQAKLFEKFYRVQTDKTRDITGTGLGLFIVKEIMEKMNGKIWVESEEGKGSTFSFSLPRA